MKKLTLKQQAKSLEIKFVDELFYYFIDSYNYGQFSQCRRLFGELTKQAKKDVLAYLLDGGFNREYNFYFELL